MLRGWHHPKNNTCLVSVSITLIYVDTFFNPVFGTRICWNHQMTNHRPQEPNVPVISHCLKACTNECSQQYTQPKPYTEQISWPWKYQCQLEWLHETFTALKQTTKKMEVWTMILIPIWVIFCCLFWTVGPVPNTSTTWTTAPRCFSRISVLRFPSLGIQTVPKTKRSGSRRWRPEARMIAGYTNNTDLSKDGSLRGNSICSYFYGWALVGLLWATLILKGDSTIPYTKNNPASIGTTLRDCHVKLGWWISCQAWWTSWWISKLHRIPRDDILSHS